jgi:acetoin utilization protein AcuB
MNEIMKAPVETVTSAASAEQAWEKMKRGRFHHLVVVEGKNIVGILSAHDLGGSDAGTSVRKSKSVSELMTANPVVVDERITLRQAANRMRGRAIGCLPVTSSNRLVGIVTTSDLLEAFGRGVQRPVEQGKRWTPP